MRMEPVDIEGTLYSSGGLRFGGFQSDDFIRDTEVLETIRPGVRNEIVGYAHYFVFWPHRFADLLFIFSALWLGSAVAALVVSTTGYWLEILRFYVLGNYWVLSVIARLSWLWGYLRLVVFPVGVFLSWHDTLLVTGIAVYFILQTWGVVIIIVGFPVRIALGKWQYRRHGYNLSTANVEGLSMWWTIQDWNRKLGLPLDS